MKFSSHTWYVCNMYETLVEKNSFKFFFFKLLFCFRKHVWLYSYYDYKLVVWLFIVECCFQHKKKKKKQKSLAKASSVVVDKFLASHHFKTQVTIWTFVMQPKYVQPWSTNRWSINSIKYLYTWLMSFSFN